VNVKYFAQAALALSLCGGLGLSCGKTLGAKSSSNKPEAPRLALALAQSSREQGDADSLAYDAFYELAQKHKALLRADDTEYRFGAALTLTVAAPRDPGVDSRQLARVLAEEGNQLVVLVGAGYETAAAELAVEFPHTSFAVIDAPSEAKSPPAKLTRLRFSTEEGAYLSGLVAGLVTRQADKPHFGFVAEKGDTAEAALCAKNFAAGIQAANPNITEKSIHTIILGESLKDAAEALAHLNKLGSRVVYLQSDAPSPDIFDLARADNIMLVTEGLAYQTLFRSDPQRRDDAEALLACNVKRYDRAVVLVVEDYLAGKLPDGELRCGLTEAGIDLVVDESRQNLMSPYYLDYKKLQDAYARGESGFHQPSP
jgi:basic membrane lipoprotein Med (substrate-binding protein (PBP1-ABC) superfamily)